MSHRQRSRQRGRSSWSALLAVLLGALAGASAFGLTNTFAGGLSIAEHNADARTTGKTASIRPDAFDPSLRLAGADGPDAALHPCTDATDLWAYGPQTVLPVAFDLPVSIARTRDGRTRAPPHA